MNSIGEDLNIGDNTALTSLIGLDNVTHIGKDLNIKNNTALINLTGLENVTSIGRRLVVEANTALTSLTGLDNVTSIGMYLVINDNPALTSLTGLDNVTSIGVRLIIEANAALTSLTGIDNIEAGSIGHLLIEGNSNLSACAVNSICDYLAAPNGYTSIEDNAPGCNSQEEVEDDCASSCLPEGIIFTTQAQIDSLQYSYPGCTEIEGSVSIGGSDINNFYGLSGVTRIGGTLWIGRIWSIWGGTPVVIGNPLLTNLSGLDSLTHIGGNLTIWGDSQLTDLSGLESLSSIGGNLSIGDIMIGWGILCGNPVLTNLDGLNSLSTIYGKVTIRENDSLTNLNGLEGVTSVGGLNIYDNLVLDDLTGLDNIAADSLSFLNISENPSLSTCDIQSICEYLVVPNGTIDIHDNAPGCNSQE